MSGGTLGEPRRDLAGHRLVSPGHPDIYLIDPDGYRRRIPNYSTYNRLFRTWCGIDDDARLDRIALRPEFTTSTILVRGDASCGIYLLDQGRKRRIAHDAVMDTYCFNWNGVLGIRQVDLDGIAPGADWDSPPESRGLSPSRAPRKERSPRP